MNKPNSYLDMLEQVFQLTGKIDWISSLHQPKIVQSAKKICPYPNKDLADSTEYSFLNLHLKKYPFNQDILGWY